MLEYSDSLGQAFGLFSLVLLVGMPVVLNRLLKVKYPLALVTLALFYVAAYVVNGLIFSLLFNTEPSIKPLDGLFSILVPIYGYVICLIVDLLVYFFLKKRQA